MGWKLLKDTFSITHHVVVTSDGVLIGSGYVQDLATINPRTGAIRENATFNGFLREHYPVLLNAKSDEIVRIIEAEDKFATSIPVYTYDGAEIIERRCEAAGWPNVTHTGEMMYENRYSTDRTKVIAWAKRNANLAASYASEEIERLESQLADVRARLARFTADVEDLTARYPDVASDTE